MRIQKIRVAAIGGLTSALAVAALTIGTAIPAAAAESTTPATASAAQVEATAQAPYFTLADNGYGELLLSATVGVPYSYVFTAAGTPAPTIELASGDLPSGFTLTPGDQPGTAVLSGTATDHGIFLITLRATNSEGSVTTQLIPVVVTPDLPDDPGFPFPESPERPEIFRG